MATNSKASDRGAYWGGLGASGFQGVVHFVVPIFMVALDIYLGPQFMEAYMESRGFEVSAWTRFFLYVWSVSTTGFMFMLFRIVRDGVSLWRLGRANLEEKVAVLAAAAVTILDSVVDVAGATSLIPIWGPEVAMNIKPWGAPPPEIFGAPVQWWFFAALVAGICGGQEYVLSPALKRSKRKAEESRLAGAGFTRWCVNTTDWMYDQLRKWSLALSFVSVACLNLALMTYWGQQWLGLIAVPSGFGAGLGLCFGLLIIFMQMSFYERVKEEGFNRKDSWNYVAIASVALSLGTSIAAFGWLLYGPEGTGFLFTLTPSPAYWLMIITLVIMFLTYPIVGQRALALEFAEKKQGGLRKILNKEWRFFGKKKKSDPEPMIDSGPDFAPSMGTLDGLDPSSYGGGPAAGMGHPKSPWMG